MANNSEEVFVAITGKVVSYATSNPAPTSISQELPVASEDRGFISDAGVTVSSQTSTTSVTAWQNSTVVRNLTTEASVEIAFEAIQFNKANLSWYLASDELADGSWEYDPAQSGGRRSYELHFIDTTAGTLTRIYIPSAEITAREDLPFTSQDKTGLGITLTAYRDDSKGYTFKIWHEEIPVVS